MGNALSLSIPQRTHLQIINHFKGKGTAVFVIQRKRPQPVICPEDKAQACQSSILNNHSLSIIHRMYPHPPMCGPHTLKWKLLVLWHPVMSKDGLLLHTGKRMSCLSKHVRECLPEADTGEKMFCWNRHRKECLPEANTDERMFWYSRYE